MSVRIGSVVVNVAEMPRAIAFWTATLSYVIRDTEPSFTVLRDPHGNGPNLSLQLSDAPKHGPNRLHLDLYTSGPEEQQAEVARLLTLGATRPAWSYPPDPDFVVLADPDGNEFCVIG